MNVQPCPFCEHVNVVGAKFCNDCGSPLHLRPCPSCHRVSDAGAIRCDFCGTPFAAIPVRQDRDEEADPRPESPAAAAGSAPDTVPAAGRPTARGAGREPRTDSRDTSLGSRESLFERLEAGFARSAGGPVDDRNAPHGASTRADSGVGRARVAEPVPVLREPIPELSEPIDDLAATFAELEAPIPELDTPLTELDGPLSELDAPIPELDAPIVDLDHGTGAGSEAQIAPRPAPAADPGTAGAEATPAVGPRDPAGAESGPVRATRWERFDQIAARLRRESGGGAVGEATGADAAAATADEVPVEPTAVMQPSVEAPRDVGATRSDEAARAFEVARDADADRDVRAGRQAVIAAEGDPALVPEALPDAGAARAVESARTVDVQSDGGSERAAGTPIGIDGSDATVAAVPPDVPWVSSEPAEPAEPADVGGRTPVSDAASTAPADRPFAPSFTASPAEASAAAAPAGRSFVPIILAATLAIVAALAWFMWPIGGQRSEGRDGQAAMPATSTPPVTAPNSPSTSRPPEGASSSSEDARAKDEGAATVSPDRRSPAVPVPSTASPSATESPSASGPPSRTDPSSPGATSAAPAPPASQAPGARPPSAASAPPAQPARPPAASPPPPSASPTTPAAGARPPASAARPATTPDNRPCTPALRALGLCDDPTTKE